MKKAKLHTLHITVERCSHHDRYSAMWQAIELAFREKRVVRVEHKSQDSPTWIIDPISIRNEILKQADNLESSSTQCG